METLLTENFWRSTNGPYAEIVYSLLVNYHNEHIFCGTFGSGILKSTPYGSYWSQTTISKMYIPTLIVSKDKFIFAGTRENGVFRSMDNGVTWNGTSLRKITINCLSSDSENFIYAGTFNNGIFVSKNSGVSWKQLISNNISCYSIYISDQDQIFASTDEGLIVSRDKGNTWEKNNNGIENIDIKTITGFKENIFIGTSQGVYYSNNLGKYFNKIISDKIPNKIWSILITKEKSIIIGTENGIFYSNDLFNWNEISSGLRNKKVYSLAINKEGFLFAGTYGWGVFKSQKSFFFS